MRTLAHTAPHRWWRYPRANPEYKLAGMRTATRRAWTGGMLIARYAVTARSRNPSARPPSHVLTRMSPAVSRPKRAAPNTPTKPYTSTATPAAGAPHVVSLWHGYVAEVKQSCNHGMLRPINWEPAVGAMQSAHLDD